MSVYRSLTTELCLATISHWYYKAEKLRIRLLLSSQIAECHFILFFECSEEVMEERLMKRGETSGRVDDNAETIKKRLKTFVEKTMPVLASYGEKNKVKRVWRV